MEKCKICNREFKHRMALKCHWAIVHDENYKKPNRSGKSNPHFGKKGRNQYSDRDYTKIDIEEVKDKKLWMLKNVGYKCEKCGYSNPIYRENGTIILQLHHIDGDKKNENRENLQILCPTCHSLTPNFAFNGRKQKSRYWGHCAHLNVGPGGLEPPVV